MPAHLVAGRARAIRFPSSKVSRIAPRKLAHVGLTRGRVENRLYVSATDGQDMRDVLGTIAADRDGTLSAHESIRAEQTRVDSVPVLMEQYQDVASRANLQRYVGTPYVALDVDTADRVVTADAWPALTNSLHQVEKGQLRRCGAHLRGRRGRAARP